MNQINMTRLLFGENLMILANMDLYSSKWLIKLLSSHMRDSYPLMLYEIAKVQIGYGV